MAGALVALVAAGVALSVVLARQQYSNVDRQVAAVAEAVTPILAREAATGRSPDRATSRERTAARIAEVTGTSYAAVAVRGGQVVASSASSATAPFEQLAAAARGTSTVPTPYGEYRARARAAGAGVTVVVGLPVTSVDRQVGIARRAVWRVGGLALLVAGLLGWVLAGPAVRPLRQLRERAALVGRAEAGPRPPWQAGTPEIDEVAATLDWLDDDLAVARRGQAQALEAARGFAASAGHELRTPLTSMSTDISVLRDHPQLAALDRAAVLDSLERSEQRLLSTLQALEQLARGDLGAQGAEIVDVTDLVLQVVDDAARRHPSAQVRADVPAAAVRMRGWRPGLRLALDNLVTNAVQHGAAARVDVRVLPAGNGCDLVVDDDGPGIPERERARVLGRFERGSGAVGSGSGLGLALVDQQARLHGGRLELGTSPAGGLRAAIRLPQPARAC